jgi:uncharacterized membrane protein
MTSDVTAAPYWALTMAYWLHMLATVAWIGGLVALNYLFIPAARGVLAAEDYSRMLDKIQRRLDPLAWLSLAVLVATGLFQMIASPNYEGFLEFSNRWSQAILVKHVVFLMMTGVSAYMTWVLLPGLRRIALLRAKAQGTAISGELEKRERALLRLNLVLGVVVLGLTALARAS